MTDLEKRQIEDLRKQGNGYKKIAQLTGLSINTVKSFCRRIGTSDSSQCMQCGKEIIQVKGRKEKKFCCDACRMRWWNSHQDQVKRKAVYEKPLTLQKACMLYWWRRFERHHLMV